MNPLTTKSTGHTVGKGLFVGAAAAAGAMFFAPGFLLAGVGLACLGGGAYLHEKLYLDDPAALAEYRNELDTKPLSTLLGKKYNVEDLLRIVNANQIREYYEREVADDLISTAIRLYTIEKLKFLHITNVISLTVFIRQTNKELDEKCRNFTEFWQNTQQKVPEMLRMGFVELDKLKQKFKTEFSWVGPEGQLYFHEEPEDGRYVGVVGGADNGNNNNNQNQNQNNINDDRLRAGEPIGLIRAFSQYFEFANTKLDVKPEFFRVAIQSSVHGRKTSLPLLIQEGLVKLALTSVSSSPLVDRSFIQLKFNQYLLRNNSDNQQQQQDNRYVVENKVSQEQNNNNDNNDTTNNFDDDSSSRPLTLWRAEEEIQLRDLLEKDLVKPTNELYSLFHAALPREHAAAGYGWDYRGNHNDDDDQQQQQRRRRQSTSNTTKATKENNIVLFCDYWEPIFKKFQHDSTANFIELQYSYSALTAWRLGVDAKNDRKRKINEAESLYDRTKSQLDREERLEDAAAVDSENRSNISQRHASKMRRRKLYDAADSLKNDTIERAHEEYEREVKLIHEDFCAQVAGNNQNNNQNINSPGYQYQRQNFQNNRRNENDGNTNTRSSCAQQ